MKRLILFFLVATFLAAGLYLFSNSMQKNTDYSDGVQKTTDNRSDVSISPGENTPEKLPTQAFSGGYKISYIIVRDLNTISLYSNLEDKLNSEVLKQEYVCSSLVSGGFYSKENTHIGLFVANAVKLSNIQINPTFNGFLSINDKATIGTTEVPNAKNSLQTGPILILSSETRKLVIKNDENARRVAAAILRDGNLAFLTIYDSSTQYSGPKLGELPGIMKDFSDNSGIKIKDAINLDGGTASFFITDEVNLPELVRAGSFFCIK